MDKQWSIESERGVLHRLRYVLQGILGEALVDYLTETTASQPKAHIPKMCLVSFYLLKLKALSSKSFLPSVSNLLKESFMLSVRALIMAMHGLA